MKEEQVSDKRILKCDFFSSLHEAEAGRKIMRRKDVDYEGEKGQKRWRTRLWQ